jgi:hypothetical protein
MKEIFEQTDEEIVFSKKVIEMLTVANDYCLFLENAEDYTDEEILEYARKIFPLIYLKASLLPAVLVTDENAAEHFVTEEQWENLFNMLRIKFGEADIYYFIDHHEKSHTDPVKGSLAENLADIYQDLKDFVLLYQKPLKVSKENAVHECKNLFEIRTGYTIVNAHHAIHYLLFKQGEKGELADFL